MLISYFLPEDGDSAEHPNVFHCEDAASSLSLGQLKQVFPLPGKYHFRALKSVGKMKVWMDLVDDQKTIESFDGEILLKVSRISLGKPPAAPARNTQSAQEHSPAQESYEEQTEKTEAPPSDKQSSRPKSERRGSEKLINFDNDYEDTNGNGSPPKSTPSPFENGNNATFFDFSTNESSTQRSTSSSSMNEFMDFTQPTNTSTPPPMMNNGLNNNRMGGSGQGMGQRNHGSTGNISGMHQMNSMQQKSHQQSYQQKNNQSRNAMGNLDPFGSFQH